MLGPVRWTATFSRPLWLPARPSPLLAHLGAQGQESSCSQRPSVLSAASPRRVCVQAEEHRPLRWYAVPWIPGGTPTARESPHDLASCSSQIHRPSAQFSITSSKGHTPSSHGPLPVSTAADLCRLASRGIPFFLLIKSCHPMTASACPPQRFALLSPPASSCCPLAVPRADRYSGGSSPDPLSLKLLNFSAIKPLREDL